MMWQTLSGCLLFVIAVLVYFLWRSDKECDEAETEAARIRESSEADQKRHADEYQQALDEIVRLDAACACQQDAYQRLYAEKTELSEDNAELAQSLEHTQERLATSEGIRQKLAESLAGRANGHQITLGCHDSKIVHGSVVVSEKLIPEGFICRKLGSTRLTDTLLLWNGEKKQLKDVELTDELAVLAD